jgi:hypothetical protein
MEAALTLANRWLVVMALGTWPQGLSSIELGDSVPLAATFEQIKPYRKAGDLPNLAYVRLCTSYEHRPCRKLGRKTY